MGKKTVLVTAKKKRRHVEHELQSDIRAMLRRSSAVWILRNNSGALANEDGRPVKYGLGDGSSDLVGAVAPFGRWLAIEVKAPGREASDDQENWHAELRRMGGVGIVVDNLQDAFTSTLAVISEEHRRTPDASDARLADICAELASAFELVRARRQTADVRREKKSRPLRFRD